MSISIVSRASTLPQQRENQLLHIYAIVSKHRYLCCNHCLCTASTAAKLTFSSALFPLLNPFHCTVSTAATPVSALFPLLNPLSLHLFHCCNTKPHLYIASTAATLNAVCAGAERADCQLPDPEGIWSRPCHLQHHHRDCSPV